MKKRLVYHSSILLIFIIVFMHSLVSSSIALTKGTLVLNASQTQIEKQEEVTISLQLNDIKTAAFQIELYFDDTKLEYLSGPDDTNQIDNRILYVWHDKQGGNHDKQGELAKFKFKAKENGIAHFVVSGEFYTAAGQSIDMNFEPTQVQIGEEPTTFQMQAEDEEGANRTKSNTNLQVLRVDQEGITPQFDQAVEKYYLTVPSQVKEIEILTVTENPNATVEVTGNTNLKQGLNQVEIEVTSEDKKEKKNYIIEVTKTADPESANTNLEILAIENVLLNPPFDNSVTHYTVEVSNEVDNLNLLAIPENEKAVVTIKGKDHLKEGNNLVNITVVAPNKITKKEYQINVHKRSEEEEKKYQEEEKQKQEELEEAYQIEKVSTSASEKNRRRKNTN